MAAQQAQKHLNPAAGIGWFLNDSNEPFKRTTANPNLLACLQV
jgi:hypothetical protein